MRGVDKRWLVYGHYGGENTGDEAMLEGLALAAGSGERPASIVVASKGGKLSERLREAGVRSIPLEPTSILRELPRCRVVVLGGGTHFHDDYDKARYRRQLVSLARIVVVGAIARALGKRVAWLGMGFGPFHRRRTRWITRLGLRMCDVVTVRDQASLRELTRLGAARNARLTFDLSALLVDPARETPPPASRTLIGVSALSLSEIHGGDRRLDEVFWGRSAEALATVMAERPDVRVRVVEMRGRSRHTDGQAVDRLVARLTETAADRVEIVPYSADPTAALGAISECEAMISSHYHAMMLGYLAGRRLLGLPYHRKVRDLAEEIGLDAEALVPIDPGTTSELIRDRILRLVDDPDFGRPRLPVSIAVDRASENLEGLEAEPTPGMRVEAAARASLAGGTER